MTQANKSTRKFQGKVIAVDHETQTLPNGHEQEVEIIRHPGGAAVVALDEQDRVCLLHQYRYVTHDWLWELPAGKLEANESPLQTAQRELAEEAGLVAAKWTSLGEIWTSPGVFQEKISLWLASRFTPCQSQHEAGEVIEIHWLPLTEALDWAKSNQITDAKTIIGLFRIGSN